VPGAQTHAASAAGCARGCRCAPDLAPGRLDMCIKPNSVYYNVYKTQSIYTIMRIKPTPTSPGRCRYCRITQNTSLYLSFYPPLVPNLVFSPLTHTLTVFLSEYYFIVYLIRSTAQRLKCWSYMGGIYAFWWSVYALVPYPQMRAQMVSIQ
jgi:hypothetical protein